MKLINRIMMHKWLVVVTVLSFTTIAIFYSLIKPAKYESSILLQIGKSQNLEIEDILHPHYSSIIYSPVHFFSALPIFLIQSPFVMESVVRDLGLDMRIYPDKFPLFNKSSSKKAVDSISIQGLKTPNHYYDRKLKIFVDDKDHYRLFNPKDHLIFQGVVGKVQTSKEEGVSLRIKHLPGTPGAEFFLIKKPGGVIIEDLLKRLSIEELGRDVFKVSLIDSDPQRLVNILNTIGKVLIQEDSKFKSSEAKRASVFLEKQLSLIQSTLNTATKALSVYDAKDQNINVPFKIQQLKQEIELNSALYLFLFNKIQMLKVAAKENMSDLRILSPAQIPHQPLPSHAFLNILAGALFGFVVGCLFALMKYFFLSLIYVRNRNYSPRHPERSEGSP